MNNINFEYMKNVNRFEILQQIYRTKDINRNLITQTTGLTGAAVTKIINSLIKEGFVSEETFYSKIRGRKARYLSAKSTTYDAIVICLCRSVVSATVVDIDGHTIYRRDCRVSYTMFDEFLMQDVLQDVIDHIPKDMQTLGCVCITPGIRSTDAHRQQKTDSATVAPFVWDIQKLQRLMEDTYDLPFLMENDSNAALLGELWFGKGQESKNIVLYNIGRGIGSSVYLNGTLLKGYQNSSIEIGHVTINFDGPRCACGNRGCLELYAGLDNLTDKLVDFNKRQGTELSLEEVFLQARSKDGPCRTFVHDYALMIAEGAVILANMFTPEKIIVTTNEADFLYLPPIVDTIKDAVHTRIFSIRRQKIGIEASTLRTNGYILGGMVVALTNHFLGNEQLTTRAIDTKNAPTLK